jgi:hypothetical protein
MRRRLPIAAVRHVLDVRVQWGGRKCVVRNGRRQPERFQRGCPGSAGYGDLTVPEVQRCGASAGRGSGPILLDGSLTPLAGFPGKDRPLHIGDLEQRLVHLQGFLDWRQGD